MTTEAPVFNEGEESLSAQAIQAYFDTMFVNKPPDSWKVRESTVEAFGRIADSSPGGIAFDLGCGFGKCTLAAAAQDFREVHAVDLSPVALGHLQSQAQKLNLLDKITIHRGDARSPEWLDSVIAQATQEGDLSLVSAYGFYEYLTRNETRQVVTALQEATSPGGVHYLVHLTIPKVDTLISPFEGNMKPAGFLSNLYDIEGWTTICLQTGYREDNHPLETDGEDVQHAHNIERLMVIKAEEVPYELMAESMT